MTLHIIEVASLLEIVASERPELLVPLCETLRSGPAFQIVLDLARDWHVEPAELAAVASRAARQLGRLEMRRGQWRHPSLVVDSPNVRALSHFAYARRGRVSGRVRSRRLNVLAIKLRRIAETEHHRRQLDSFLREPAKPVDPEWLKDFLRRPGS